MVWFLLIQVSVWVAMVAWFFGACCRSVCAENFDNDQLDHRVNDCETAYRWLWLLSAVATCVHIIASYGLVHHWDHQAVLQQTADESFQVTGIRADWGVYVNFAFAAILLAYSVAMLIYRRRIKILDSAVFWFTAFIIFNAGVVFKSGPLRVITFLAFVALFVVMFYRRFRKHGWPAQPADAANN